MSWCSLQPGWEHASAKIFMSKLWHVFKKKTNLISYFLIYLFLTTHEMLYDREKQKIFNLCLGRDLIVVKFLTDTLILLLTRLSLIYSSPTPFQVSALHIIWLVFVWNRETTSKSNIIMGLYAALWVEMGNSNQTEASNSAERCSERKAWETAGSKMRSSDREPGCY